MQELSWEDFGPDVQVARDKEGKFHLRDLSKPTSPILAHDIPSVPGNILHISDLNHPSLAVGNMLQLNLGKHQNWETLTTHQEFGSFFFRHLRDDTHDQSIRVAEMRMEDLAVLTQEMAVDHPGAGWFPMTTARVLHRPDATEGMSSAGTALPALKREQPFGVSYKTVDRHGALVQNSVMLFCDSDLGNYRLVSPTTSKIAGTIFTDPKNALLWFMETVNLAPDTIYTVLYHVPPQTHEEHEATRQMNAETRYTVLTDDQTPQNVSFSWIGKAKGDAFRAKNELGDACEMLEAENSFWLMHAPPKGRERNEIFKLVKDNRAAIALLGQAYADMALLDV